MEYPYYKYPAGSCACGASLGNYYAFARLDEHTNLRGLWSPTDNQYYAGEWDIDFIVRGKLLRPGETIFSPESQTTKFSDDIVSIEKQFFLPYVSDRERRSDPLELRSAIALLRVRSLSAEPVEVLLRHRIYFPAAVSDRFNKQRSTDQTEKRVSILQKEDHCEIVTVGSSDEVRIFGSTIAPASCKSDDKMLMMEYRVVAQDRQRLDIPFIITFSPDGLNAALEGFRRCGEGKKILEHAINNYGEVLSRSFIFTPESVINRGLQWAKVNTVRVQHRYRIGDGFTNDPPQDIVVLRDLAWYVLGSDYLTQVFSRNILSLAERYAIHDDGKITEYIHANEQQPVLHDYNLNINDDTPLFVYALYHHAVTSADDSASQHAYPLMKYACDYLISQIREGLVRCRTGGSNVWGICSWRNIIDEYNLTGAVTEINAECYYALTLTAEIAGHLGKSEEALRYEQAGENLKKAINEQLISEKTGMYLLNIDNSGIRHHDVTGDLIFPILFEAAAKSVKKRILRKLTDDEMWTPYGSRTVSMREKTYDPDRGCQLMGGVWHNLTAWIAYCLRDSRPDKLKEGMINIYRLSEIEKPKDFQNVVPGEFPERLHGETFQSRGMAMSPWSPPTYLWLGVEGLLGVRPTLHGLKMNPSLPSDWKWIGVKNLLWKGKSITAFFYKGILYSTFPVESSCPTKTGDYVDTFADNDKIFSVGIKIGSEVLLFVSSDDNVAGNVGFNYEKIKFKAHVRLRKGEALLMRISLQRKIASAETVRGQS